MILTKQDVARVLDRLATVYRVPKGTDITTLGDVWMRALVNVTADELQEATDAYLRSTARFFPKPGELLAMVPKRERSLDDGTLRGRYLVWFHGDGMAAHEPCPVCGSALDVSHAHGGRYVVLHDHQRHFETGIPYAGPRTGPMQENRMVAATGPRE